MEQITMQLYNQITNTKRLDYPKHFVPGFAYFFPANKACTSAALRAVVYILN